MSHFAENAKAYVALLGLVAVGLTEVAPESWQLALRIILAVSGAFAVWATPNADAVTDENDGGSV